MIAHRNDGIAGPVVPAQALGRGADHAARIVDPAISEISAATAQEDGDLTAVPSAADALQLGNESRGAGETLRAVPPEWRTPEFQTFPDG